MEKHKRKFSIVVPAQVKEQINEFFQDKEELINSFKSLIEAIKKNPRKGKGKPHPLTRELNGYWSRYLTKEYRVVYTIVGKTDSVYLVHVGAHY